jgi:hypothetical protein
MNRISKLLLNTLPLPAIWLAAHASAQVSEAIALREATVIVTLHAEGAQVYACQSFSGYTPASGDRALTWQLREPVATLLVDGKTVGRHTAGPNWDHVDGSGVRGKVFASAPGATANDIPWLKLDVAEHRGNGILSNATTVKRINTKGGVAQGSCESEGQYLSVPYSADYVFLRGSD